MGLELIVSVVGACVVLVVVTGIDGGADSTDDAAVEGRTVVLDSSTVCAVVLGAWVVVVGASVSVGLCGTGVSEVVVLIVGVSVVMVVDEACAIAGASVGVVVVVVLVDVVAAVVVALAADG